MIDLKFNSPKCCTCGNSSYTATKHRVFRGFRWALRCNVCGKFWRYATDNEKAVIKARLEWLKDHEK